MVKPTAEPHSNEAERRAREEVRKTVLKKYMLRTEDEADLSPSELSEKSFDNKHEQADSPRGRSPLFDSKKLEKMEWELSMDRTRLHQRGRLSFFLNCVFCVKFFYMLPLELIHMGGWYFLIPLSVCALVLGVPLAFLELALGQFTSQLVTVIFSRMAPIAAGIGLLYPCLRVLLFLHYRTEHRIVALILESIQKIFFTRRNVVCMRQNSTDCYIPGVCQPGEVFYHGGCYNRAELWNKKQITSQMNVRLAATELLQHDEFVDAFVQPIPHVDRIFNLDDNAHKLDSVIAWFIIVFLLSKIGVHKLSRWMPIIHLAVAITILTILPFLLSSEPIRNSCALYFQAVGAATHVEILWDIGIWQTAAVDALSLLAIGDGTLHALGAMNPFWSNIFWDVFYTLVTLFVLAPFSIFFFGTVIVAGMNAEQREVVQGTFDGEHISKLVEAIKVYPYKESCMHPLYYFSWIDEWTQHCASALFVVLFVLQVAPYVLLAENVVSVVFRMFNRLSRLNKSIIHHCVLFNYYLAMAALYTLLVKISQGDKEHIGMAICYLNLATVTWECLVVHRLYNIERLLVNIRTMFDKSEYAFRYTKTLARPLYHLWSWFIPGLCGLLFVTSLLRLLREIQIHVVVMALILVGGLPIYVATWLVVREALRGERLIHILRPTTDWGPFTVMDKKNAKFDEKAVRMFV